MGAVEDGTITLIGATTENPSFEVISALLSRCQVYILESLGKEDLMSLLERAVKKDEKLKELNIQLKETDALFRLSGGDARKLLNLFELVIDQEESKKKLINDEKVKAVAKQSMARYDKDG